MSKFIPNTCEDCSYPPNHIVSALPNKEDGTLRFSVKCRNCNDAWEEDHIDQDS